MGSCLFILIILLLALTIEPLILMWLWNWLTPLFWTASPVLTFWQALGICFLLSIIGGFFKSTNNNKY